MARSLERIKYWHIWKGCKKISPACQNCFIKNFNTVEIFDPVSPDLPYGSLVIPCLHSDFFIEEADQWRNDIWKQIKKNSHIIYLLITKRIERVTHCLPEDWGEGYDNVIISCTVETQNLALSRIPILKALPCKHKWLSCCPLIEPLYIKSLLMDNDIEHVECCGEIGNPEVVRPTYYEWVEDLYKQCLDIKVRFSFMKVGNNFIKDGHVYSEKALCYHSKIADKCNLNYNIPLKFILDNKEFILE